MKVEIYKGKSLTAAEISLMHLYERREEAYQIAEEKRKKELQLVNESIASMINPSNITHVKKFSITTVLIKRISRLFLTCRI